jgi:hypothetical protein
LEPLLLLLLLLFLGPPKPAAFCDLLSLPEAWSGEVVGLCCCADMSPYMCWGCCSLRNCRAVLLLVVVAAAADVDEYACAAVAAAT